MGLRSLLKNLQGDFRIVGEASEGKALLELLATQECDLLITDFSMPGGEDSEDGLLLLRRLRRRYPNLPIIVLTMIHNPALVRGMLAAGANGVVGKTAMTKELLQAMQTVTNGRAYLGEGMQGALGQDATVDGDSEHVTMVSALANVAMLSPREAEVVRMYANGLTVTQIAERLRRSVKTVSQQKSDAMRKLGLTSNTQLYEFARGSGLLT